MTRVAPIVPAEQDILCEDCGYTLNGLPDGARCTECGLPVSESTDNDGRRPSAWERDRRLLSTTVSVLFRPTRFYRTLTTRTSGSEAHRFAMIHWSIASLLLGSAAFLHFSWALTSRGTVSPEYLYLWPLLIGAVYLFLEVTTRLAARLSSWEGTYRGLRLPHSAVLRSLFFHSVHYLPVGIIALLTVIGYRICLEQGWLTLASATKYLYVLCFEVIISAAYLFYTYWIGMRNIMFANR
jgi:hypothetical protein